MWTFCFFFCFMVPVSVCNELKNLLLVYIFPHLPHHPTYLRWQYTTSLVSSNILCWYQLLHLSDVFNQSVNLLVGWHCNRGKQLNKYRMVLSFLKPIHCAFVWHRPTSEKQGDRLVSEWILLISTKTIQCFDVDQLHKLFVCLHKNAFAKNAHVHTHNKTMHTSC